MSARKYFNKRDLLDARKEYDKQRRDQKREAQRAHDLERDYYVRLVGRRGRPRSAAPWKPIHQVFLSIPLPVPGSFGFGAVVRRSL